MAHTTRVDVKKAARKLSARERRAVDPTATTLTATQIADAFDIERDTAYRWARDGVLPSVKKGRTVRFPRAAIEEILGFSL